MGQLAEDKSLKNRKHVFEDRRDAGKLLAGKLIGYKDTNALLLAIPSGGLPVADEIAKELNVELDIIIARKLQIPFSPEAGFGAMGPSGEIFINEALLSRLDLTEDAIEEQIGKTAGVIRERESLFRKGRPYPQLKDKNVIIVDDGLASGYTMLAALQFVKKQMPARVTVAIPTGPSKTIERILVEADEVICLNIRGDFYFAVAAAYRNWYDLGDEEVLAILADRRERQ